MELNAFNPSPLYEKIIHKSKLHRGYLCLHLLVLVCFLGYRILNPLHGFYGLWMLSSACEFWFAFMWVLYHNFTWASDEFKTNPERLAKRYGGESAAKLPAVDIFISTTDPFKEPALITANTVLSVLALDYPVDKFACYISDDGASPITFYSLVETLSFAKNWVPFCRKFSIQTRAPFMYFSKETKSSDPNFLNEWQDRKVEYESLKTRIDKALETGQVPSNLIPSVDGFAQTSSDIRNHSSIVQVIHENKGVKGEEGDALPHLIYVAREKRPKVDHHYKAGAMNVMARVSAVMTNAPFTLNLDSDMHVNDCRAIQHAMCFFLDCKFEKECGFVQFPQVFYGGLKDDPFGNQMKVLVNTVGRGMNGIQGPFYGGTCCFHRRKGLYGVPPYRMNQDHNKVHETQEKEVPDFVSSCSDEALRKAFGESPVLVAAAQTVFTGNPCSNRSRPPLVTEEALKVASCSYETNTAWGKAVGWMYGSTVEDALTGLKIHNLGWHSIRFDPKEPVFMGCVPRSGPDSLVQQKRWATGQLEIFASKSCPFLGIKRSITLRQRMAYAYFNSWAICSLPVLCYAILPAWCLIHGKSFLPKVSEFFFPIAAALFLSVYGFQLLQYIRCGCSLREWWNNQRMWFIVCISSWLFALFDVVMKLVGLSETVFVVTPKGSSDEEGEGDEGEFTFDSTPLITVPITVLFINMAGIIWNTISLVGGGDNIRERLYAEYLCSFFVVINLWPFVKGLVRKGKKGIPWSVIIKSGALAVFICSTLT